jgi:ankyrin repeat protein
MNELHIAYRDGNVQRAKALLLANEGVNAKNRDGWTPLHFACENGHKEIVQMLLLAHPGVTTQQLKK